MSDIISPNANKFRVSQGKLNVKASSQQAALFDLQGFKVCSGSKVLLDIEQLSLPQQRLIAFIGPNGAGKSTLLHSLLSQHIGSGLKTTGSLTTALDSLKQGKVSGGKIAWVGQHERFELPLNTLEYVLLGVSPKLSWYQAPKPQHIEKACQLLSDFELYELIDCRVQTLSGGEKQRLAIVRALMQETEVLMFDEPTNHLDIRHQRYLLSYLQDLVHCQYKSIVVVLHDLTHAFAYSDEVVLIDKGCIVSHGSPERVMTKEVLSPVYQVDIQAYDTEGGRVFI